MMILQKRRLKRDIGFTFVILLGITFGFTEVISAMVLPRITQQSKQQESVMANSMNRQFPTVNNPQSVMYIFGHYAGNGQIPVTGHFVPFSLYPRNYYALPSEIQMPYNDGQFS